MSNQAKECEHHQGASSSAELLMMITISSPLLGMPSSIKKRKPHQFNNTSMMISREDPDDEILFKGCNIRMANQKEEPFLQTKVGDEMNTDGSIHEGLLWESFDEGEKQQASITTSLRTLKSLNASFIEPNGGGEAFDDIEMLVLECNKMLCEEDW